jgi:7-cyano-7-deazaguanine tRNA-ribosyltransferase
VFSISSWDGLAKIGEYHKNKRFIRTPDLFPVVDPRQNQIPIQQFKDRFGFNQVITSAYLMSKRHGHNNFDDYEDVHSYLDYDGMVMMDSGAYQVMLYGDIELGVEDTIHLQEAVQPDIGVIMDHPIGYDVSYAEAQRRLQNTLMNIDQSLPLLENSKISWTLPIQGGKYLDLLASYLDQVVNPDYLQYFDFFALGSVVPVMINQDYETLVRMIALARKKLPVTYPLHLFGAGHPAMFALATFLGCDTFDSAAYALMAKDDRYMTINGTYQLSDLTEFPCACDVCISYSPAELIQLKRDQRGNLLSQHNLWVSQQELRTIREAIRQNTLWDLVSQRASSVPNLARATNFARKIVLEGELSSLFEAGTPLTEFGSTRISRKLDVNKVNIRRVQSLISQYLLTQPKEKLILVAFDMKDSIYNKIPNNEVEFFNFDNTLLALFLPPFGIVPIGMSEVFPIGQLLHELEIEDFDISSSLEMIGHLKERGLKSCDLILPPNWPKDLGNGISALIDTNITYTEKPVGVLRSYKDK